MEQENHEKTDGNQQQAGLQIETTSPKRKRRVLTVEEKAAYFKKKGQHLLIQVNVQKKKYRTRLLINYALMRLKQSHKNVEQYETEILAFIESEKQGKKGGANAKP